MCTLLCASYQFLDCIMDNPISVIFMIDQIDRTFRYFPILSIILSPMQIMGEITLIEWNGFCFDFRYDKCRDSESINYKCYNIYKFFQLLHSPSIIWLFSVNVDSSLIFDPIPFVLQQQQKRNLIHLQWIHPIYLIYEPIYHWLNLHFIPSILQINQLCLRTRSCL